MSEFKDALDALGLTPTEYARATGVGTNQIHCRARGIKNTGNETMALLRALAEFKTGGKKLSGASPHKL